MQERLRQNKFTLTDLYDQLVQMKNMGSLNEIAGMLPGVDAKALEGVNLDDNVFGNTEAIILSMTPQEREEPSILNNSRKKRIAAGAGVQVVDVNRLLKQYDAMLQFTKMTNNPKLRKMAKKGRLPGMGMGMGRGRFPF